jgi:hydroxypyruvate isomerase
MERWSAHVSMLFTELPPLDRPAAARAAGFSSVETWWPGDADAWADAVARAGVEVALVNADAGDIGAGERGFLNVPALRDRELRRIDAATRLAGRVGAPRVNVLVGRLVADVPRTRQIAEVASVLREAGALAAAAGVTIVVEPLNAVDVPGYLLPTAADARALISAVGSPNIRLLYDAYHAARAGADPVTEGPALIELIDHVQYADCPGRGAPGTGTIDLARLLDGLLEAGYTGRIGLEYDPRGDTLASLPAELRQQLGRGSEERRRRRDPPRP